MAKLTMPKLSQRCETLTNSVKFFLLKNWRWEGTSQRCFRGTFMPKGPRTRNRGGKEKLTRGANFQRRVDLEVFVGTGA